MTIFYGTRGNSTNGKIHLDHWCVDGAEELIMSINICPATVEIIMNFMKVGIIHSNMRRYGSQLPDCYNEKEAGFTKQRANAGTALGSKRSQLSR
jgi:hypothetical protein